MIIHEILGWVIVTFWNQTEPLWKQIGGWDGGSIGNTNMDNMELPMQPPINVFNAWLSFHVSIALLYPRSHCENLNLFWLRIVMQSSHNISIVAAGDIVVLVGCYTVSINWKGQFARSAQILALIIIWFEV